MKQNVRYLMLFAAWGAPAIAFAHHAAYNIDFVFWMGDALHAAVDWGKVALLTAAAAVSFSVLARAWDRNAIGLWTVVTTLIFLLVLEAALHALEMLKVIHATGLGEMFELLAVTLVCILALEMRRTVKSEKEE